MTLTEDMTPRGRDREVVSAGNEQVRIIRNSRTAIAVSTPVNRVSFAV